MNRYIRCWAAALEALGLAFEILDQKQNCLRTIIADKPYLFYDQALPFVMPSISRIAVSKDLTYDLLHPKIKMPQLRYYIDFDVEETYQEQVEFRSYAAIIADIEKHFNYPIFVSANRTQKKVKANLCADAISLEAELKRLFDQKNPDYYPLTVVEEYLEPVANYMLLFFQNQLLYCIQDQDSFVDEKAEQAIVELTDKALVAKLLSLVSPLLPIINSDFIGFRVSEDASGVLYLQSLVADLASGILGQENSSPLLTSISKKIISAILVAEN